MPLSDIQVDYPTAIDTAASVMGKPLNRQVFTLNGGLSVSSTSMDVNGTAGGDDYDLTDLNLPCLLLFEGGEIWYIESGDVKSATNLTIGFDQRAQLGSSLQIHNDDEEVYAYFSGKQHEVLVNILINLEKFPLPTSKQADPPTLVGEAYVDSNYDIYVSFNGTTYTKLQSAKHTNLDDLPTGATSTVHGDQYMHGENTTFSDWHDTVAGEHINAGDDHTHLSEASSVKRIAYGAALPTVEVTGQIFLDDGDLFFVYNTGDGFEEFFGIPAGCILPFPPTTGCPAGWTAYTALNSDAYLKCKTAGTGGTGGNNTHTHTIDEIESHTHTILEDTCTSDDPGSHGHTIKRSTAGGVGAKCLIAWTTTTNTSTFTGSHSHTASTGGQESATTSGLTSGSMSASFVSDSSSTEPAYTQMKWCKKD